jgi:3'(2'), 5'-bisphosphate nucleotidase
VPKLDASACAAVIDALTDVAAQAADRIVALAGRAARTKDDGSPVTAADEAAEDIICAGLGRLLPDVPVISEEQATRHPPQPAGGSSYFLVDPLDGTREFIAGRYEYTVNIALVTDGVPLLGIICTPAHGQVWRGIVGRGADQLSLKAPGRRPSPIHARPRPADQPVVLVSRSHLDARTSAFLDAVPGARAMACGSSVKFCRIAEGAADLYPRLAPTRDWDVAAGHAILTAAGGTIAAPDGSPLRYGTSDFLLPAFIAAGA